MSVERIHRGPDGVWYATVGGCVPYTTRAENVPPAELTRFVVAQLGALGGLVDDIQAAARPTVLGWVRQLNDLIRQAQGRRDRYLALTNTPQTVPQEARVRWATLAGEEQSRAQLYVSVLDWLYATAGALTDLDTFDATDDRDAVGALQVPVAIAGLVSAAALSAWVADRVAEQVTLWQTLDHNESIADKIANATPEQAAALAKTLAPVPDDGMPWWVWAAGGLGIIGTLYMVFGGDAA